MKVEIIFPIYNEELNIKYLISSLYKYLYSNNNILLNENEFHLIFVNDGSSDNSLIELIKEAKCLTNYKIIDLTRNFGHQNALSAAFTLSNSDVVIVMDADLQDPLFLIEKLLEKFIDDVEIVHAVRVKRDGETFLKKITADIFYRLFSKLTTFSVTRNSGDCKLYSKKVISLFNSVQKQDLFFRGLSNFFGFKSDTVVYNRDSRKYGTTKYPYSKLIGLASKAVINFPEKLLIYFGNFYMLVSFLLFLFVMGLSIYEKITNGAVKGWTSLITTISMFNLLNTSFLYIIGLYIAKITKNTINYPNFVISKIISNNDN